MVTSYDLKSSVIHLPITGTLAPGVCESLKLMMDNVTATPVRQPGTQVTATSIRQAQTKVNELSIAAPDEDIDSSAPADKK